MKSEAEAFDKIIEERISGGVIPDLQKAENCEYFYNNVWRYSQAARLHFGETLDFIYKNTGKGRILEVGCGSGFISLELARAGFDVLGIDISRKQIQVAEEVACKEILPKLAYIVSGFESVPNEFDFGTVIFVGSLHHIPNLERAVEKCKQLLRKGGHLIVVEPAREYLGINEALVLVLIRSLLKIQNKWYGKESVPFNQETLEKRLEVVLQEIQEGRDLNEGEQSPNDGENRGQDILEALAVNFNQIAYKEKTSLFSRLAGGIRGSKEEIKQLIAFLHLWDKVAVNNELLSPDGFMWAGKVKE